MSAYLVDVATIDVIISGARQYGGQTGFSFYADLNKGAYRYCKFSRYASEEEADGDVFNPDTMGRELWQENLRSIHARYPDTLEGGQVPGSYADDSADGEVMMYVYGPGSQVVEVDPLGLLGAIRGYEYQACETGDAWRRSVSYAFCQALKNEVIAYLVERTGANAWTVDDLGAVSGDLMVTQNGGGGWAMRFTPGESEAVSLTEMIVRGR